MNDLELILRETGAAAEWPATPDLVAAVRERTGAAQPRASRRARVRRPRLRRPLAIAIAALLALSGGAAAIPAIRDPVLDFLGLRSVKIERVPRLPLKPAPSGQVTPFGRRVSLDRAIGKLGFTPLVPATGGPPRVYLKDEPPGGQVTLVYRGGGLALTELRGHLDRRFLMKFIPPGTAVDRVRVQGERGLWIHGQVHEIVYMDEEGTIRNETARLAGNVLLWRSGPVLLRLEGARTRSEALRVAGSVRATP